MFSDAQEQSPAAKRARFDTQSQPDAILADLNVAIAGSDLFDDDQVMVITPKSMVDAEVAHLKSLKQVECGPKKFEDLINWWYVIQR